MPIQPGAHFGTLLDSYGAPVGGEATGGTVHNNGMSEQGWQNYNDATARIAAEFYKQGLQEGQAQGLTGDALDQYATNRQHQLYSDWGRTTGINETAHQTSTALTMGAVMALGAAGGALLAPAAAGEVGTLGAIGGADAEALAAADAAGGLIPAAGSDATLLADAGGLTGTMTDVAPGLVDAPPVMPPAIPEVDPTFGETLTQTGTGQFEDLTPGVNGPGGPNLPGLPPVTPGVPATPADGGDTNYPGEPTGQNGGPTGDPVPDGWNLDADPSKWTAADWARLAGAFGPSILGYLGSQQYSSDLKDIANQQHEDWLTLRGDRMPFLDKSTQWLEHPNSYLRGPAARGAIDAVLRAESVTGNPFGSPFKMEMAGDAALRSYNDAWSRAGAIGTGTPMAPNPTADIAAAGADAQGYNAIGYGIGNYFNPPMNLYDLAKANGWKVPGPV